MKHNLQLTLVMVMWALCFPLITVGIQYSPHLTFAAIRALLSGIVLLFIASVLRQSLWCSGKDMMTFAAIGVGATTLAFFGMFHAAEFVTPGIATVIASSQPLMAALLAHWFLKERLNLQGKLGLLFGFSGISLISLPQFFSGTGEAFGVGTAYIVIAAIGITISNVIIKQIANRISPLIAMGWQLVMGSIPLAIIAFLTEAPSTVQWTPEFIWSLFGLSVAGTAFAYWAWYKILETTKLSHANAFTFLVPIFGLGMGIIFYGEQLSTVAMGGVVITLIGIHQVS